MSSRYTISTGQRAFPKLIRQAEGGKVAVVTRRDKAVAYVISAERMDALLETVELLANPAFVGALKRIRSTKKSKLLTVDAIPDAGPDLWD
jgi:prevent-host-death family protein